MASEWFEYEDIPEEHSDAVKLAAREAYKPLKALYDATENELMLAVANEDFGAAAQAAWLYGPVSQLVTMFEMQLVEL
jgi:hypothetical protein